MTQVNIWINWQPWNMCNLERLVHAYEKPGEKPGCTGVYQTFQIAHVSRLSVTSNPDAYLGHDNLLSNNLPTFKYLILYLLLVYIVN